MVVDNMLLHKGGVLGYSPNFYDIGKQAGDIVTSILNGTEVSLIPVQNPNKVILAVSLRELNILGLTVSENFLVKAGQIIR